MPAVTGMIEVHGAGLEVRFDDQVAVHLLRSQVTRNYIYAFHPHKPSDTDYRVPREDWHTYQRAAFEAFFCGVGYTIENDADGDLTAVVQ